MKYRRLHLRVEGQTEEIVVSTVLDFRLLLRNTDLGKLRSSISEVADELAVLSGNPLR
ncbi:hypothetical protein [Amycolatopsis panacis]|uniref:hypothetical protein n=1 Tax=Amycolatopsis panacis TaxID=2340917 RepID=UPI0013143485|nr:hypothetical protein [Amycolatopsis panacis]